MNEDTVEVVILQAAGSHRPSSSDISPILALIEEGYDLDQDIVPVIRRMVGFAKGPITSWRFFIGEIRRKPPGQSDDTDAEDTSNIRGNFADGPRPVWWIEGSDPRYRALAERWAREKKQRRPSPIMSKYFKGFGWAFPAHWVDKP